MTKLDEISWRENPDGRGRRHRLPDYDGVKAELEDQLRQIDELLDQSLDQKL